MFIAYKSGAKFAGGRPKQNDSIKNLKLSFNVSDSFKSVVNVV